MKCFWFACSAVFSACIALFCNAQSLTPSPQPAYEVGNTVYVSAQYPIDPATGMLINGNIQDLTTQAMANVIHVLHNQGFKLNQVVKVVIYLADIRDLAAVDSVYNTYFFSGYLPARDVFEVVNLQYNNSRIGISCIAVQ